MSCGRCDVIAVNPKPHKGLASSMLDLVERFLVWLMHDTKNKKGPRNIFLLGNHAPVDETSPCTHLHIRGNIPDCLNGEFGMVGSNPKFVPTAGYHWFDGDGMIHGLRIKDGKATYVSRYVRTSRYKQEEYLGGAKFMKAGDFKGLYGLLSFLMQNIRAKMKVLDDSYGTGTANTAIVYHQRKLLALHEGDKPYVVKILEDGDIQTHGILDYDKRLSHSFCAHPKIDPFTNEMFVFGYSYSPPYVTYRVITKDGLMLDPVSITIPALVMMHDFAITENYAIFMDLPLYIKPEEMLKGNTIFSFDATKKSRFGVLPRYARSDLQIRWFELPSCCIYHTANAWEEDDEVVLISCRVDKPYLDIMTGTIDYNQLDNAKHELYEMRFNMKTGDSSQKQLSVANVDFPRINDIYTGRKQRYVYCNIFEGIKVKGIVKFDLWAKPNIGRERLEVGGNIVGIIELEQGKYGSETVFVPCNPNTFSDEDDGYLIFFVYNENIGKSEVNVFDAKTMSPKYIAVVELPNRVPYGFHAFFVTEEQLREQDVA